MNTITMILTAAALILTMVVPFAIFYFGERSRRRFRKSLTANIVSFFGVLLIASIVMLSGTVTVHAAEDAGSISTGMGYIAAALVTGISGIGSGIAVASSASAALGADEIFLASLKGHVAEPYLAASVFTSSKDCR